MYKRSSEEFGINYVQRILAERAESDLAKLERLTEENSDFRGQRQIAASMPLPDHDGHVGLNPVIVHGNWLDFHKTVASFGAQCPRSAECKQVNGPTIQFVYVKAAGWKQQT